MPEQSSPTPASKDAAPKLQAGAPAAAEKALKKEPSLRERLEEAMKDGKVTSEELRAIAAELDAARASTATEIKNLKAVVGDFGLRILEEYTVKDKADVEKLDLLLKALKKADFIKDDIAIEKLPEDGKPMKLRLDTKEKKMRPLSFFEGISTDADETRVTVADQLRVHFANAVLKDEESRIKTGELIDSLRDLQSSSNSGSSVYTANEILKDVLKMNPIPENIRVTRNSEIPKLIAFLEEFKARKDEPVAKPADIKKDAPKDADKSLAKPEPKISAVAESNEKAKGISAFINALSTSTETNRITRQVAKHAKKEIETALSHGKIDDVTMKALQMPIGTLESNRAFQDAIGMKQPNDGYIGRLTINALLAKAGSNVRLPENHFVAKPAHTPAAKPTQAAKPADAAKPAAAPKKAPAKAVTDKKPAEDTAATKKAAEKTAADKLAAEQKAAADKLAADKLAAEQKAAASKAPEKATELNKFLENPKNGDFVESSDTPHVRFVFQDGQYTYSSVKGYAPVTEKAMRTAFASTPAAQIIAREIFKVQSAKKPEVPAAKTVDATAANVEADKKFYAANKKSIDLVLQTVSADDKAVLGDLLGSLDKKQGNEFVLAVKDIESYIKKPVTGRFDQSLIVAMETYSAK